MSYFILDTEIGEERYIGIHSYVGPGPRAYLVILLASDYLKPSDFISAGFGVLYQAEDKDGNSGWNMECFGQNYSQAYRRFSNVVDMAQEGG